MNPAYSAATPIAPPRTATTTLCLLGLSPILVASDAAVHGGVLTLATTGVLLASWLVRTICPASIGRQAQQAAGLVAIAAIVAALDIVLQAWNVAAYNAIGTLTPLLALVAYAAWFTNAECDEARTPTVADARRVALLACLPLLCGGLRELLAHASLFADAGSTGLAAMLPLRLIGHGVDGLLIVQRAPFVLLALGLLLALLRRLASSGAAPKPSDNA